MKEDPNMKQLKATLEKQLSQTYEKSGWEKFKDFMGIFTIGIFILIIILVFLILGVYLIENPVSLAIICGTILLLVIWSMK